MSLDKLQQLVGSLTKNIENKEKLATPVLAAKLAKYKESYPHDQTIGSMELVLSKMANNKNLFITKGELKALYNKLYSRNTKFAELFQQELGLADQLASPVTMERDEAVNVNPYQVGDSVLANALNSVFDNQPLKMYSQDLANKAKSSVASTLDAWNLSPNAISIDSGNDKFLVLRADYDTPKGLTSFYVPVEINNNKIVEASVFMGNSGPQELNHISIKSYLTTKAGSKLAISADSILNVLNDASSENRDVSDAEIALVKLNASREKQSEFFQNQVVGLKIAEASAKDVELPKLNEFESFEKQFTSPYGIAAFHFGEDKVKLGRDHIVRELSGYGCKNAQVVVGNSDENTIFYSISLDAGKVAFTVPVKLANGKINKPNIMLCNGSAVPFNKEGINGLYVSNQSDYKAAATASPLFGLKPSDIINNIKEAIAEENYAKAEDALNVLANTGDEKAYATGFNLFLVGLSGKKSESSHTCNMVIKNAHSSHPICGHTGLPLHKVYQDKHGNCLPLYRQNMDETYEGASFMNSKIFG